LARKLARIFLIRRVAIWDCIIENNSRYNSSLVKYQDDTEYYGLFGFSKDVCCGENEPDGLCNIKCSSLN
jgi:hypothetical protein